MPGLRKHAKGLHSIPLVSVIMAVYNGAGYLREAVESVLNQSFTDFEFIIVNDASTDTSEDIIRGFADPRIVRISNPINCGLAFSLNLGLRVARGKYVARQDADDVSLPDRLTRQVRFLEANRSIKLIGTGSKWIDHRGELIRTWNPPTRPAEIQMKILRSIPILHATIMFELSCLLVNNDFYDESFPVAQDTDFIFRFSEAWDVSNIADVLYIVRQHDLTTSSQRSADQLRYLNMAQISAIDRRLFYGWGRLGISGSDLPDWVQTSQRRWLAQRFIWWSACSKAHSKYASVQMLLIAMLLDPIATENWKYIFGILGRKTRISSQSNN